MLQKMKTLAAREDGFTLVELMVVVAILAVLLLMAVSTFAGVKSRAQDSAAKQGAARALETGRIVFTDQATYATAEHRHARGSRAGPAVHRRGGRQRRSERGEHRRAGCCDHRPYVRGRGLQRRGELLLHPRLDHDRDRLRGASQCGAQRLHRGERRFGDVRDALAELVRGGQFQLASLPYSSYSDRRERIATRARRIASRLRTPA